MMLYVLIRGHFPKCPRCGYPVFNDDLIPITGSGVKLGSSGFWTHLVAAREAVDLNNYYCIGKAYRLDFATVDFYLEQRLERIFAK